MKDDLNFSEHENAERILREGWTLFQQKGYRGVSIDELCMRCGLTKPTLYYYFHDKENLFVQVLRYRLKGFHQVINQPGTIQARLECTASTILESFHAEYSLLLRDMEHIKRPDNQAVVNESFQSEMVEPIVTLMQNGINEGVLAPQDPAFLAQVFMGMINAFISRHQTFKNQQVARQLVEFFLRGAGASSASTIE
jgi:AcrR family transcriptional regulator